MKLMKGRCTLAANYQKEAPRIIKDFLSYHQNILNHSPRTVQSYYLDLRMFFRHIKLSRGLVPEDVDFDEIDILDVDLELIRSVGASDILDFLAFLSNKRSGIGKLKTRDETNSGLTAVSRARKLASIRSFYGYLCKTNRKNIHQELRIFCVFCHEAPRFNCKIYKRVRSGQLITLFDIFIQFRTD